MRKIFHFLIALLTLLPGLNAYAASHVTVSLQNATSTSNQIEFDVYIVNDGTTNLALAGYQFGINFSSSILNGGTPGTSSFAYLAGTRSPAFAMLSNPSSTYSNAQLRSVATTTTPGVIITTGTQYILGRYRFTNTVNWTSGSVPNFQFQLAQQAGKTMTIAQCFVNGAGVTTSLRFDSTTLSTTSSIGLLTLNVPLPVSLINFRGEKSGSQHLLTWRTGEELNNSYFNLQHSTDGVSFSTLGKIHSKAEKGNSQQALDYSFIHADPVVGHNYYRLEQIDIDGQTSFSGKIIDLEYAGDFSFTTFPNPANDELTLRYETAETVNCLAHIYDLNGHLLKTVNWLANTGKQEMKMDISSLAPATYMLQFICNGNPLYQQKFQKQ